jgi:hypothetical protein
MDNWDDDWNEDYQNEEEFNDGYQISDGESDLPPDSLEGLLNEYGQYIDGRDDVTGLKADNTREWISASKESRIANKEIREHERALDALELTGNSPDERMGKMTAADLQLGRFSHMSAGVRSVAKEFLEGNDFSLSSLDAMVAREEFASIIGGSPTSFAKQLKVDGSELPSEVHTIDPISGSVTGSRSHRSEQDISTALGMIKDTAGAYLDKGVGANLAGFAYTEEKKVQNEDSLREAFSIIEEASELFIHPKTVGSSVEGQRRKAVKESLTNRLLSGTFSEGAKSILPLPNELPVLGLKPTLSYEGYLGTSFDRVGFEIEAEKRGWVYGTKEWFQNKPDIKTSLYGKATSEEAKRARDYKHQQLVDKLHIARKTLREAFPTLRDESAGQANTSGWDRPYGDQALEYEARDIANTLGLDMNANLIDKGKSDLTYSEDSQGRLTAHRSTGTEKGGQYGEKELSEVDVFSNLYKDNPELKNYLRSTNVNFDEENISSEYVKWQLSRGAEYVDGEFIFDEDATGPVIPDMERFVRSRESYIDEGIEQRTPEWYAARKGLITASTLIDKDGKQLTSEQLALDLSKRKLGVDKEFIGNDYSAMGSRAEPKVLAAFLNKMKSEGTPLSHKEVGLITKDEYGGMGVSPDGRLFDAEGESAGLLEMKYLTKFDNIEKYEAQMQMQMMVTGEEQTHFFAMNRYTDETVHKVIKADPKFQKKLKERIDAAQDIAGGLTTAKSVKQLEVKLMEEVQTAAQRSGKGDATGQTSSVDLSKEVEEIKSFSLVDAINKSTGVSGESSDPAPYFRSLEQKGRKDALNRGFNSVEDMEKFDASALQDKEKAKADAEVAKAAKERAKADEEASKASKQFTQSVKDAVKNLSNFALGANESSMDTVRAAAMSGMSAEQARGIEFAMTESGATLQGARTTIAAAGNLQARFNDVTQAGGALTNLTKAWEGAGLSKSFGKMPSMKDMQGKSSPEIIAFVKDLISQAESPEQARQIAGVFGMEQLATSTATGAEILDAGILNEDGARGFNEVFTNVTNTIQTVSESAVNFTGSVGGAVVGAGIVAGGLAGAIGKVSTVNAARNAVKSTQTNSATKGNISNLAKSSLSGIGAAASKVAKAGTPLAAVSGVGRLALGVEDDGGVADSLLDIAEFTAAGAAFGPAGAVVGAVAGVGNEIGEMAGWWDTSDADDIPTKDIVDKPTISRGGTKVNNVNDIDVNVSVTPDGVKTNITANGEDYSDMEVYN